MWDYKVQVRIATTANSPERDTYVTVRALSTNEARELAEAMFGGAYSARAIIAERQG